MFTPRPLRRPRGAHAAPRGGDVLAVVPSPPPQLTIVPPEPPGAVRALASVMSGNRRVAASYLTALPDGELAAAGEAARTTAELAAAVARVRQHGPGPEPPAGFRLCLGCSLGDPACGDPACARWPQPRPVPAPDEEAPGQAAGDRSGCD